MWLKRWLPAVAATLLGALAAAVPLIAAGVDRSSGQGHYVILPLPPGSSDVLLSRDGARAAIAAVTFDRQTGRPARVLQVIAPDAGRVVWRRSLPSPTCCAFPVIAATPQVSVIALGGAEETMIYDQRGKLVSAADLYDGLLHTAVDLSSDGRLIVGEWEGYLAVFEVGRARALWVRRVTENVMAVAISGRGGVAATALRDRLLLLRLRDGVVLREARYGPARIATVAISADGHAVGLVWKRDDGRMVVDMFSSGRRRWTRELGPGSVPLLQVDGHGRWLAVGDLLGRQAVLLGWSGEIVWTAAGRGAVAVAPDGRSFAVAQGTGLEIRTLPAARIISRRRLPAVVHLIRLTGPRVAVLGSADPGAGLPDRVWFAEIP